MGAGESIIHDPFSIAFYSDEDSEPLAAEPVLQFPQPPNPPVPPPPATLPASISGPFSLSASSGGSSAAPQNYTRLGNLSHSERNNVGATLSLLLSRSDGSLSDRSNHPVSFKYQLCTVVLLSGYSSLEIVPINLNNQTLLWLSSTVYPSDLLVFILSWLVVCLHCFYPRIQALVVFSKSFSALFVEEALSHRIHFSIYRSIEVRQNLAAS